jgi:hypothetical protein
MVHARCNCLEAATAKEPFTTSSGLQSQRTSDLSSLAGYNTRPRGRILSSLLDEEVVKCFSKRLQEQARARQLGDQSASRIEAASLVLTADLV